MKNNDIDKNEEIKKDKRIVNLNVKDEMEKSFISYAMAVNISRAIPDVRDGLKPVHRRILYAMGELNLFNEKPFKKSARIVGDVMGKYHPHGDSAIYDALVRLAQDFSINAPLVEGHGNFGSIDGDPAAAQRYTEARLSKIAFHMLNETDKNTVDFYPNFDESEVQPVVLPARFPNLLVNGSDGIAVGMATNIPPHNLGEVIDGVIALIENPNIDIDGLMEYIPAPDMPTRGLVISGSGIRQAYHTGRGTFIIRARAEIEEYQNGNRTRIVITEIPYQVNKSKLIMQIADHVRNKRIEGISDIKEESDREGLRIVIEVKRDANAQVVLNLLYKHTQLQTSFGIIMLALVNNTPKVLNLLEMLQHYLAFQKEVIIRRTQFDLDRAEQRAHILQGLVIAQANIDEVIRQIKLSSDRADALVKLTTLFELTEKQAQAILEMRLQRLTGLEVEKLKMDLLQTENLIKELKEILGSDAKIFAIIKRDLQDIKAAYAVPRKSEISFDYTDINIADLIAPETVVISLTHEGYVKRLAVTEYRSQRRGGKGMVAHRTREEDFVENIYITNTHDDLLCFSNLGKVYTIKAFEVPEASRTARGRAIVNLLQIEQNERITAIIPITEYSKSSLVMATKNGFIKKTSLLEFESVRRNGKIAITLNDGDELIAVYKTTGKKDIMLAASNGLCIRFNEKDVRKMGRLAQGVRSIRLGEHDIVVDMVVIDEEADMLTISENGFGKRSDQADYRTQSRYGKGIKAGVFNEETGGLINLKQVKDTDDVILIADDGQIIRVPATEISKIGRNTKGVRVMRIKEDTKIISIAVTPSDDEDDEDVDTESVDEKIENTENNTLHESEVVTTDNENTVTKVDGREVDEETAISTHNNKNSLETIKED